METVTDFIFLGSKITADGDCSHEIKRCVLLGRKAMTNLDSVLKIRGITLPTKVHIVKAMVFPVVMYGCKLDHKEDWVPKNWCFWTVVLEKTLESLLDCKEVKSVNPKGNHFSSFQLLSHVWLFATPWTAAHQASLSITNCQSSLKLMSIESVMPFNHRNLSRPLLLMPSIFSSSRVFYSKSVLCIRWPKVLEFQSQHQSCQWIFRTSFRIDWLDLLAIQGTLESLLQPSSSKASILRCSAVFTVQLSHPYMTTGKTIALTRRTFVGKVSAFEYAI